jgi:hypothetical protein
MTFDDSKDVSLATSKNLSLKHRMSNNTKLCVKEKLA